MWWHSIFTLPAIGHSRPLCRPINTLDPDRDSLHTIYSLISIDIGSTVSRFPRFWNPVDLWTAPRRHLASFRSPSFERHSGFSVCFWSQSVAAGDHDH